MPELRTALFDWHVQQKARMVPFGGWEMPVQYSSIVEEHTTVRASAGLFDIGHMARLSFGGADALAFLERICTNAIGTMKLDQVRYSLICNEAGGILDDVLVYRWPYGFSMVVNASNRRKILAHLEALKSGFQVDLADETERTGMVAVQGPRALELVAGLFDFDVTTLKYYYAKPSLYCRQPCVVSRTGYTGEDGVEIIVSNDYVVQLAEELVGRGAKPCGLGARDTLRLEAAMPLYGHELSESIDPLTAGLAWAVKFTKGDFIGRAALQEKQTNLSQARVGLQLEGKRAAREGATILHESVAVGSVTSGSYAPHLQASIAMGYVPSHLAQPGTALQIDIRGTLTPAVVVSLPFYSRTK